MRSLLDTLTEAVVKGDMDTIRDTLQAIAEQIIQMLSEMASDKARQVVEKIFKDFSKMRRKVSNNKANLNDIRTFANNTKETLKIQLGNKILDKIKEHR